MYNYSYVYNIAQLNFLSLSGDVNSIKHYGNYIFVGTSTGVYVLNSRLQNLGFYSVGNVRSISLQDNYMYLANGPYLTIMNITDPNNLLVFTRVNFYREIYQVELFGSDILIGTASDFKILQIGSYISPKIEAQSSFTSNGRSFVSGYYALLLWITKVYLSMILEQKEKYQI
jgi:hypothetical protein